MHHSRSNKHQLNFTRVSRETVALGRALAKAAKFEHRADNYDVALRALFERVAPAYGVDPAAVLAAARASK